MSKPYSEFEIYLVTFQNKFYYGERKIIVLVTIVNWASNV
jgi:hypothetical protein